MSSWFARFCPGPVIVTWNKTQVCMIQYVFKILKINLVLGGVFPAAVSVIFPTNFFPMNLWSGSPLPKAACTGGVLYSPETIQD